MLGVSAAVGRVFNSQDDDQVYQGHPVVVLSHAYWTSRFAGDPSVVGRKVLVNNYPMIVVGVSQAGSGGVDPTRSPHIRVPNPDEAGDGSPTRGLRPRDVANR
jgi:hypothetical protein